MRGDVLLRLYPALLKEWLTLQKRKIGLVELRERGAELLPVTLKKEIDEINERLRVIESYYD